jgi:hypothetical protein
VGSGARRLSAVPFAVRDHTFDYPVEEMTTRVALEGAGVDRPRAGDAAARRERDFIVRGLARRPVGRGVPGPCAASTRRGVVGRAATR